jgi:hypothetical protein
MQIRELQNLLYHEYVKNGYRDLWTFRFDIDLENNVHIQKIFDLAEIGLFDTEIAELKEEIRKKEVNWDCVKEECSDIIIRVLNFCSRKGIFLEDSLLSKNEKNFNREKLHGKDI